MVGMVYNIEVTTGDKTLAGTGANVYIVLYGEEKHTSKCHSGKYYLGSEAKVIFRLSSDINLWMKLTLHLIQSLLSCD